MQIIITKTNEDADNASRFDLEVVDERGEWVANYFINDGAIEGQDVSAKLTKSQVQELNNLVLNNDGGQFEISDQSAAQQLGKLSAEARKGKTDYSKLAQKRWWYKFSPEVKAKLSDKIINLEALATELTNHAQSCLDTQDIITVIDAEEEDGVSLKKYVYSEEISGEDTKSGNPLSVTLVITAEEIWKDGNIEERTSQTVEIY